MKECLQAPKLNQYAQHKNEHNAAVLDPIVCKVYKNMYLWCQTNHSIYAKHMEQREMVGMLELRVYLIMESDDPDRQYLKTSLKKWLGRGLVKADRT